MHYRLHKLTATFRGLTYTMAPDLVTDEAKREIHLDPDYLLEIAEDDFTPNAWLQLAQAGASAVGYAWMGRGALLGMDMGDRILAVSPPKNWLTTGRDVEPMNLVAHFSNKDTGESGPLEVDALVEWLPKAEAERILEA